MPDDLIAGTFYDVDWTRVPDGGHVCRPPMERRSIEDDVDLSGLWGRVEVRADGVDLPRAAIRLRHRPALAPRALGPDRAAVVVGAGVPR